MRRIVLFLLLLFVVAGISHAQIYSWRKKLSGAGLAVGLNPRNPSTIYAEGDPGTFFVSYDRGVSWSYLSSPGVALIRQILVHPSDTSTIFCTDANSGLVKSTNGGQSWRTVIRNFGIDGESLTLDPNHPDTMYAGNFADGRVYRTTDRGESWVSQGFAGGSLCAFTCRPDSPNVLLAGTGGGTISKSTDGGAQWRIVKGATSGRVFQEVPKIVVSPSNPLVAFATINGDPHPDLGVWKTTDGGESWSQSPLPLTGISTWGMAISESNPEVVYAGTFNLANHVVFKTTDGGSTWSILETGLPSGGYLWNLKVHPTDSSVVLAGVTIGVFGANGIYRLAFSTTSITGVIRDSQNGDTVKSGFFTIPTTGDFTDLSLSGGTFSFGYFDGDPTLNPQGLVEAYPYYAAYPVLSFTPDSALHQTVYLSKLPHAFVGGSVHDSLGNPVKATVTFSTVTPQGLVSVSENTDSAGDYFAGDLYASIPPITSDYSIKVDPDIPYRQLQLSGVHLDPVLLALDFVTWPADIFLVGEDSISYVSGYTAAIESLGYKAYFWNTVQKGPAPFERTSEFIRKTLIYFTANKHTPMSPAELSELSQSLGSGSDLFITGQDILERNDTAAFFSQNLGIGFGANTNIVYCKGVPGDLFDGMGFYTTLFSHQTSRDTLTFSNAKARRLLAYGGLGNLGTSAVRIDSAGPAGSKVVVMGFGFEAISTEANRKEVMRRILGYFDGSIVLGAGERALRPPEFRLEQNFPNPFNPATTIVFEIPRKTRVALKVFDALGREVASLFDGELQPGVHSATWNAEGYASGVYFLRITGSTFSATREMMLLK